MKTIFLPINLPKEDKEYIELLQKQQSSVIRSSYKNSELGEQELRNKFKDWTNLSELDSWFIQSGIKCGIGKKNADIELAKDRKKSEDRKLKIDTKLNVILPIFGGKKNFFDRLSGKISKIEYKKERLFPLHIIGESPYKGNRKFKFNFTENNLEFRPSYGRKIKIELPRLKNNIKRELHKLQEMIDEKRMPISILLKNDEIGIIFDDTKINKEKYIHQKGRVLGIDMNPSYIGVSVQDKNRIISSKLYNLSKLTVKSGEESSSDKSKYLNNKLSHETKEIAKDIVKFAKANHVEIIGIENLKFAQGDKNKGKNFNRITQNVWKRKLLVTLVKKHASYLGIKVREIDPKYSSTIGNLIYDYPDPIAASLEIGRRTITGAKLFPILITKADLQNRWKESVSWCYSSWKELHELLIKNLRVKYRVDIPKDGFKRFNCDQSRITYIFC